MTLIELVVAIAIVVTLFGAVGYGIGALTGAKAKTASTELAASMRALSTTATLGGKTCRLVFQLPTPDARDRSTSYWGECAPGDVTALADDSERRRNDTLSELELKEQERIERAVAFSSYTDEYISKHTLPDDVHVEVWTPRRREVVTAGLAPVYFFRHGVTERAFVWLRQGSNTWTLRLDRLTGQATVTAEDLPVPST